MRGQAKTGAMAPVFSGLTTNQDTAVGTIAPNTIAATQYPPGLRTNHGSSSTKTMPQTPPQKASEMTRGTPKGGTGSVVQGVAGVTPAACKAQIPIWWKVRVARNAATKPSASREAEVE